LLFYCMVPNRFVFQIKLSRTMSVLHLFLGICALAVGLDMGIFHIFIPETQHFNELGYIIGTWFLIIVGAVVVYAAFRNISSPLSLLVVSKNGVALKASPGFTRSLTFISWEDIADIREGEIYVSSGSGHRVTHSSLKVILQEESKLAKDKITGATIRWQNGEVDIDSTYFAEELEKVIDAVKSVRENANRFEELNADFEEFLERYPLPC
jgi:hypothetical protein